MLRVVAVGASGQLGGTERVLLDLASHARDLIVDLRVVLPVGGPLVAALADRGVPAEEVRAPAGLLRGSQQPGYLGTIPRALFGTWQWSRRLRVHPFVSSADVVYTVAFKAHLAAALARLRPLVWHLHEFPPTTTGGFWRAAARRVPHALIANSGSVAEAWGSPASIPAHHLTTVYNGVDVQRFVPRPRSHWIHDRLGLPRDRRLIGMPAVLARWKGHPIVAAAFREIADEFPDVDLVFVGGSIYDTAAEREYGAELQRLMELEPGAGSGEPNHPTPPRVHLLPFQEDIERVYPEFGVTVHYSVRPEPFGRVIVESMACGVPVIAADEAGPREILGTEGEGGWLVTPRDPNALARHLREVLQQPEEHLRDVGEAGRRRAKERFGSVRFAEEVAAVFRRVVSGGAT